MFQLAEQKPIELKEFLADYNQASWLGYISKDEDRVNHGQWTVRRAVERNYEGKADVYLSYNPLKGYTTRKKANVGKLALLYVDLDIGRGENPFEDDTTPEYKQSIVDSLEECVFGVTVPAPNFICDSGRGLYLIYKIYQNEDASKQEHANAAERWGRVNSYFTSQFEDYCADRSVSTDEARVLRIPGSINSHTGRVVQFYRYSDQVYTLYNIERDYMSAPTQAQIDKLERVEALLGVSCTVRNRRSIRRFLERHEEEYKKAYNKCKPSEKQLKYAADIARILEIELPNFRTAGGASRFIKKHHKDFLAEKAKRKNHSNYIANDDEITLKMLERRLKSLEKVLMEAPRDSYRETGLFLYRLFACEYTGDKKLAADMTRELLNNMANPIPEKSAMRTTRSAEKYWENGSIYKMKDSTLADWFGMSLDEWKDLLPRDAYKDDKALRKARNRRYYENKLEKIGEPSKKDKIATRRENIARLLSDGKARGEICAELQISERTYYSDIKYIQNNMPKAESQDIDMDSAKKLDASSNSGPVGPNRQEDAKPVHISSTCILVNPFTGGKMYSKKMSRVGEWSALFEVPGSIVGLNDS